MTRTTILDQVGRMHAVDHVTSDGRRYTACGYYLTLDAAAPHDPDTCCRTCAPMIGPAADARPEWVGMSRADFDAAATPELFSVESVRLAQPLRSTGDDLFSLLGA